MEENTEQIAIQVANDTSDCFSQIKAKSKSQIKNLAKSKSHIRKLKFIGVLSFKCSHIKKVRVPPKVLESFKKPNIHTLVFIGH